MAVDDLVPCIRSSSTAVKLTAYNLDILVSLESEFQNMWGEKMHVLSFLNALQHWEMIKHALFLFPKINSAWYGWGKFASIIEHEGNKVRILEYILQYCHFTGRKSKDFDFWPLTSDVTTESTAHFDTKKKKTQESFKGNVCVPCYAVFI